MAGQGTDPDGQLVRLIDESYAPPPLTASDRARLRSRLDARLERARPGRRWWPVAAAALPAVLLALFVLRPAPEPLRPVEVPTQLAVDWASDLLYPPEIVAAEDEEGRADALPEEYRAIEVLLAGY